MKTKLISLAVLAMLSGSQASAQLFDFFGFDPLVEESQKGPTVKFAYDADFEYHFDNREFDTGKSLYTPSSTIHGMRLTPAVGLDVFQNANIRHRVMLGVDIFKQMGESPVSSKDKGLENTDLFREITFYYSINVRTRTSLIKAYAGALPRRFMEGDYGKAFVSDSLAFYDNNIEGVLINIRRPEAIYELGLDWMGMFGSGRRERFMVFSYGEGKIGKLLSAGWTAQLYHMANSAECKGVVDNILLQPFIKAEFAGLTSMQKLTAKLSWLQGGQQDRVFNGKFEFPMGGQLDLNIQKWNVGIQNSLFVGTSMMPYCDNVDAIGYKYGRTLYRGDPFYKVHSDVVSKSWKKVGAYDRFELYYQPHIADFMDLRLSIVGHFAENEKGSFDFAGSRQRITLLFNLDKVLHPTHKKPNKAAPALYLESL